MKIKWKVSEAPTGRYRSFHKRGWPTAEYENGDTCAAIYCDDAYYPNEAKTGDHPPLTLRIADHSTPPNSFTWRKVKNTYKTLAEAKAALLVFLERNPEFVPKPKLIRRG